MKKMFVILIILLVGITGIHAKKSCKDFRTWEEANTYFKAKKSGYKGMDRNHNGKPCESLWEKAYVQGKQAARIRIYQYGSPAGYGKSFSSMRACEKERIKLTKSHIGSDYSYKCEEK